MLAKPCLFVDKRFTSNKCMQMIGNDTRFEVTPHHTTSRCLSCLSPSSFHLFSLSKPCLEAFLASRPSFCLCVSFRRQILQRSWTSFEKTARWVMDFDDFAIKLRLHCAFISILYKRTTQKNPQRQTAFSEHPILTTPLDLQGIHKNPRNLTKSEEAKAADLRKGRMPTRNKVLGFDLAT